jgi:hypothetical protein
MIKKLSFLFTGYLIILTALYFSCSGDKFTPSSFGKWAMIITPIYLLIFIVYSYSNKSKNEK